MLIPCMIEPKEDELTFSWLNRLMQYNYATSSNLFYKFFLNPNKYNDQQYPKSIEYDFTENLYYFKTCSRLKDL